MEDWLWPLHDADGMRAVDRWAIEERGIASLELMEAAGGAVATAVTELSPEGPVRIVCGKGNNAGDGLVVARRLAETGYEVEALLLWPAEELSEDAAANLERFSAARVVEPADIEPSLAGSGAVVDAIFGTGFSGSPRDPAAAAIEAINRCGAPVVACDIASGVDASSGEVEGAAVEAEVTVGFHAAKLGHLIAPGKACTGELRVAPIGIPDGAPESPAAGVIGEAILELAPKREAGSTKFTSGQVVAGGWLAGADRGGLHGRARRRSGPAPATRRSPSRRRWSRSSSRS